MKKIRFFYLITGAALCIMTSNCIYPNITLVSSISMEEELWLNKGSSVTLTAEIYPPNASNKNVWWLNDDYNEGVLDVDAESGVITALNTGEAVVTVFARDGSRVTGSIKIIVPDFIIEIPDSLVFDNDSYPVFTGNYLSLGNNLTVTPSANFRNFVWSSSNTSIADVNQSGLVTGISAGNAVITISSFLDPDVSASVSIIVKEITEAAVMTPQEIFESLKGQKVITYGWADIANGGAGMTYANPENFILIDDINYPNPANKYMAFIRANIPSPTINNNNGVISGTVNDNPKFIIISGDIDLSNGRINDNDKSFYDQFGPAPNYNRINANIILNLGSNTTIIGINNARIMFGGVRINNKSNIIIRNVTFWDAHGSTDQDTRYFPDSKASIDALEIRGTSNGIWIDHCRFTNGTCSDMIRNFNHDGALDIPAGKNITVSWNEFTNHDKVMLVAGDDSLINVFDRQITLHHNYFHSTTQRMPRTRGTQMHVYNNYYNNIGVPGNNGYAMGPGVNAQFIVENNYFGSVRSNLIVSYYDSAGYPAIVWSRGNNQTVRKSIHDKTDDIKPWVPGYTYSLINNSELPTLIPERAGPTLMFVK